MPVVKDGYTKLGFMGGMAVPAVIRYGYGFVQGAEYAAVEDGVAGLEIIYNYTGAFAARLRLSPWLLPGTRTAQR